MKTVYDLYHWSHPDAAAEITYGLPSFAAAAEASGANHPAAMWVALPRPATQSAFWLLDPTPDGRQREWGISERRQPETDAERVQSALGMLHDYGQTDGDHHKAWVIDQVVRRLTADDYDAWIAAYRAGEDGPETYSWDEGIAP